MSSPEGKKRDVSENGSDDKQISKALDSVTSSPSIVVPLKQHFLQTSDKISSYTKNRSGKSMSKSDSSSSNLSNEEDNLSNKFTPKENETNDEIKRKSSILSKIRRSRKSVASTINEKTPTIISSPSQRLINDITKVSMIPVKTGFSAVNMITPSMPPNISSAILPSQKKDDEMSASTMNGISRSFAGFLTAASMCAGFQDIEDEDAEVESFRKNSSDLDKGLYVDATSCAPDNENSLEKLDTETDSKDDVGNYYINVKDSLDQITDIQVPTSAEKDETESIVSNDTIQNDTVKKFVPNMLNCRTGSTFELSIVKKMAEEDPDANEKDKDFLTNKAVAISNKLKEVFQIDDSEIFIDDYACWLMGDVLLQGHLYITDKNILFFAFLPKLSKGVVSKTGSLSIKSFSTLRMTRKWMVLRGNTFSVYSSPKDLYFPELVIDLRTALRAETYGSKTSNALNPVWIKIITENRTHWFQADNYEMAKSWVTSLKKHIFASANKGDQVAIKIPLPNIIDLELTSVIGVTKNLRIKVIENAESFAIDDYFVMFFSKGDEAVNDIKKAIENAGVPISSSIENNDEDDLKNSELVKSRIEMLKKSTSSVKSTNYKPKPKKGFFKELKDSILSSDEDDDDDYLNENNEHNESVDSVLDVKNSPGQTSTLSKTKKLIPSRLRSKSVRLIPGANKSLDQVKDSTHMKEEQDSEQKSVKEDSEAIDDDDDDDDDGDDEGDHHRWPSKIAHGISYLTHNLIFAGPALHFDETDKLSIEGQDPFFVKDKKIRDASEKRFHKRFSLPDSEKLIATYHAYLTKGLPTYGKIYIGKYMLCFRSTIPGSSTVMILPLCDVETVNKESGFRFGYSGLVVVIRGHEELFFEFSTNESRDDCEVQILKRLDIIKGGSTEDESCKDINKLASSADVLSDAKVKMVENRLTDDIGVNIPIIVEDHPYFDTEIKPSKVMRFVLLTIGSRGDVQPYIALGKALLKEGHKVKIVTHSEFKSWVESYNIEFAPIAGDPSELMSLMVTHPNINYSFIKEAKAKFREWIDDLLTTSWIACKDADVLVESPSSIAGIHISEKLQIPYFRAFTMPWTRTRAYPHAFLVPDQKLGGAYNYMTHVAFENGYWRGTCYQVNKWRVETLGIPKTSLSEMHQNSVPFLYNMSPVVFPPSVDFPEWVKVTGYWFLDESQNYEPPQDLVDFIEKARKDNKKVVYIGFGSIVVENPKELTQAIIDAVLESDVRCIMNKGWSDRLESKNKKEVEVELPPEIFNSGNVPHDWLFTQIDAAVHHGGSGTTGASLRFGLPTIIKPFFGDQKFYAGRVEDLGCGVALKVLDSKHLAKALKEVTTNSRMIEKAKIIGDNIRSEKGVQNAVNSLYSMMSYAKKLSVSKYKELCNSAEQENYKNVDLENEMEGSWLLV